MKKLRLTKLVKLPEKKLAEVKGGNQQHICVGCLCGSSFSSAYNDDGKYATK
ncbi:MAG: hypothetical protein HXX16_16915 [Bacteroidales bacterium]|nr:hypothetical protein [Bacteroidales bacterium]